MANCKPWFWKTSDDSAKNAGSSRTEAKAQVGDSAVRCSAALCYVLKRMGQAGQCESAKAEITAIYHENMGRYGYRHITMPKKYCYSTSKIPKKP